MLGDRQMLNGVDIPLLDRVALRTIPSVCTVESQSAQEHITVVLAEHVCSTWIITAHL